MCKMYGCTPLDLNEQDHLTIEYHWHLTQEIRRAENLKAELDANMKKK